MMPTPALARKYQPGYSEQCFREVYREEYIPGTASNPGRVRSWYEQEEVPCQESRPQPQPAPTSYETEDDNSCIEGAVLGGLAGAAGGAALSRGQGNFIGIPLGIVGGALIGCQIDGG